MDLRNSGRKSSLFIGFCLIVAVCASGAFAWGGGGRHFGGHFGFYGGFHPGYPGWGYYGPSWQTGYTYATPSIGAVVAYLPDGYTSVVVGGYRYYYCDGYYFRSCPSGYVIVPAPVVYVPADEPSPIPQTQAVPTQPSSGLGKSSASATQESKTGSVASASSKAEQVSGEMVTVNIPNANGGFTSVKLTKFKDGFKGPQGEFYKGHPTVEELRVLYGR